jgi:4-hydroxy-2-oxoglutarate aldolase
VDVPRLNLAGIFPPIPTPFGAEGEILFDRLRGNLDRWNQEPMAGVVVGGSNGEFPLLSVDERVAVVGHVRQWIAPGRLLIAGSGMQSTAATVSLSQAMAGAGADGVIVVTPGYYKARMTPPALLAHYTAVADRSPVPIVIYNVPANTGVDLPAEVAIELSHHPNVAGIKDSSADTVKLAHRGRVGPDSRCWRARRDSCSPPLPWAPWGRWRRWRISPVRSWRISWRDSRAATWPARGMSRPASLTPIPP